MSALLAMLLVFKYPSIKILFKHRDWYLKTIFKYSLNLGIQTVFNYRCIKFSICHLSNTSSTDLIQLPSIYFTLHYLLVSL